MESIDKLDCAIYLQPPSDVGLDRVASTVAETLGARTQKGLGDVTVILSHGQIDVRTNAEFDPGRVKEFPDGFLNFRFMLEFFAAPPRSEDQLTNVGGLLSRFWSLGWPAVAACDYEDQLPRRGGYKDRDVFALGSSGPSLVGH